MKIGITERGDAALDRSWKNFKADGKILITKHPQLLVDEDLPSNVIVHCTITGFGSLPLEPNVTDAPNAFDNGYMVLLDKYGPERVVLRVDPILPWEPVFIVQENVLEHYIKSTKGRVRISFLDAYPHVRSRIIEHKGLKMFIPPWTGLHAPLELRKEYLSRVITILGFEPEICGEPDLPCTGCISTRDLSAMGLSANLKVKTWTQRSSCLCLAEKSEMLHNKKPCKSGCLYCYWR